MPMPLPALQPLPLPLPLPLPPPVPAALELPALAPPVAVPLLVGLADCWLLLASPPLMLLFCVVVLPDVEAWLVLLVALDAPLFWALPAVAVVLPLAFTETFRLLLFTPPTTDADCWALPCRPESLVMPCPPMAAVPMLLLTPPLYWVLALPLFPAAVVVWFAGFAAVPVLPVVLEP